MESISQKTAQKEFKAQSCGCCDQEKSEDHQKSNWVLYVPTGISLVMLLTGIALTFSEITWFAGYVKLGWFIAAYLPVGGKVLLQAAKNIGKGQVFNEFLLMGIATLGAFFIGEYAEAVGVMLFYVIGEHFQESAVKKSRKSIKNLIDNRPENVTVFRNGLLSKVHPSSVEVGEVLQLKAGEKIGLDGVLLSERSAFNTSALTGESKPTSKRKGEKVLAGMINLDRVVEVKVSARYENSALAKILQLVEEAANRKAKTQKFIARFAKIYTPIVFFGAVALTFFPYFFVENHVFQDGLYRALVFLVISCPCALVVSIPLGYYGGIGAASKNGILFKGANYLDLITKINAIVFDKTGTLTKGVFEVQKVEPAQNFEREELLVIAAALESQSNHPIAKAISNCARDKYFEFEVSETEEIFGHGLNGIVNDKKIVAGNTKLFKRFKISYPSDLDTILETTVLIAINGKYAGYICISDEVKKDVSKTIEKLHRMKIGEILMLSGDKTTVVQSLAKKLKINTAYGDLLPQHKIEKVENLKNKGKIVAFVGDGINDAPVIALADVGIAMGALGSDAAIETADVVIQNDEPSKIITAIRIGKKTKQVVWQNIGLAFGIKALILSMAVFGVASLWGAVFADVGVALLAILNAVRMQWINFEE